MMASMWNAVRVQWPWLHFRHRNRSVLGTNTLPAKFETLHRRTRLPAIAAQDSNHQQQQLNLSVLRFSLGIPGLDESYLPRWIGVACGALIVLNHFLSPASPAPAQLRSEALGICLAAFSAALPYFGKFLKGANPVDRLPLPEGNKQIFVMSENLSDFQREDLAWGSYVLLRNTNTMSVIITVEDVLCIRGYWNIPEDFSKGHLLDWFKGKILQIGFLDLKETVYFPQITDSQFQDILPNGTLSLLIQPVHGFSTSISGDTTRAKGFLFLASNMSYAYSNKDRAWIGAIAKKLRI